VSRSKARETFSMQDLETVMQGIASRLRPNLINEVMWNSCELVKIEHTLKQVVNVKGD
jgi:hypothetical protein